MDAINNAKDILSKLGEVYRKEGFLDLCKLVSERTLFDYKRFFLFEFEPPTSFSRKIAEPSIPTTIEVLREEVIDELVELGKMIKPCNAASKRKRSLTVRRRELRRD